MDTKIKPEARFRQDGPDWIDSCWNDMQQRAAVGETLKAEDYLSDSVSTSDAIDLIYAEFILRTSNNEKVSPQEFYDRFPEHASLLRRQLELDQALSSVGLEEENSSGDARDLATTRGPAQIGKYTIISHLSSGGQADVFRAVHPEFEQEVVLKLARHTGVDSDQVLAEGRFLASLEHSNIVRIFDVGFHRDRPFLVSHFIRGRTIDEFVKQEDVCATEIALMVADIARGLAEVHQHGIAHLDVKPKNVLVDERGHARLVDFGLGIDVNAAHEDSFNVRGTLAYMSPEQASGDFRRIGPSSDVFGLGALLLSLLAGEAPYGLESFEKMLDKARQGNWRRDLLEQVPRELRSVIAKALCPTQEGRIRTAMNWPLNWIHTFGINLSVVVRF